MEEKTVVAGDPGRGVGRWCRILALCGFYGALLAALAAMTAGFGSRGGLWHFRTGFAILTWAAWGGMAAAVIALVGALAAIKARQWRSGGIALLGLVVGVIICAVPYSWQATARAVPPIHDISTDIDQPPLFVAILPLRKDAPNPAEYGGSAVALQQRAAYPDIRSVVLSARPEEAFTKALAAARALGWKIVAAVPAEGRIEATDTTFWFGFTDDIVMRITPADDRSQVDIRSVSRVGRSDVGTNAKRIRAFLQRLAGAN
jgi:uncharacterized protein (DUF1499 family)